MSTANGLKGSISHFSDSIPETANISKELVTHIPNAGKLKGKLKALPLTHRTFQAIPGIDAISQGAVDPQWVRFVNNLVDEIGAIGVFDGESSELPGHLLNEDPLLLRSAALHPMLPMGHPPLREYDPSDHNYSAAELDVWHELCDVFWGSYAEVDYTHVSPGTTSGPYWQSSFEDKATLALEKIPAWLASDENKRAWVDGDYNHLADEGIHCFSYLQRRLSPERPGKERLVHTSATLLGGLDPIPADKRLQARIDGNDQWATYRARPVHAVSATSNWQMMYALNLHLKGLLYTFPEIYRVLRKHELDRRLARQSFAFAVDFGSFDFSMEAALIETFLDRGAQVMPDWGIASLRRTFFCGLYSPALNLDGSDAAWLGRPDALSEHYLGLPSGHCMNVPLGRLKGAWSMIVMLSRAGIIGINEWRDFLDAKLDIVSGANSTDDCMFFFKRDSDRKKFQAALDAGLFTDLGDLQPEFPAMYLGMTVEEGTNGGAPQMRRRPSGVFRALVPERTNDPRVRPTSALGWFARLEEYGPSSDLASDATGQIWTAIENVFSGTYGASFRAHLAKYKYEGSILSSLDSKLADDISRIEWDPAYENLLLEHPQLETALSTIRVPLEHVLKIHPYIRNGRVVAKTEARK